MKLTTYNKILDNGGGKEVAALTNLWYHCDKKGNISTWNPKREGFVKQLKC